MGNLRKPLAIACVSFLAISFIVTPLVYVFSGEAAGWWAINKIFMPGSAILIFLLALATFWDLLGGFIQKRGGDS